MIAVIFEVEPASGQMNRYLDIAAALKVELENVDGFISVERFRSLSNPEKLLSLSVFEDEEAVATWRNLRAHRMAQKSGRSGVFADYRLRVAQVLRDYGMVDRVEVPADSHKSHP